MGYTYILTNKNKTVLYTGVTSNLAKRIWEHKTKRFGGFTKQYNVDMLIYYEVHQSVEDAIRREKVIKMHSRKLKEALIAKVNPEWKEIKI